MKDQQKVYFYFYFYFLLEVCLFVSRCAKPSVDLCGCEQLSVTLGGKGVKVGKWELRSRCGEQRNPASAPFTQRAATDSTRLFLHVFFLTLSLSLALRPLCLQDKQKDVERSVQLQRLVPANVPVFAVFASR